MQSSFGHQTVFHEDPQISSAAVSDRGLSQKRPQNEDSYLEMRQCGIFAVADGVGGAQAGDVASQMAMEILGEAFANRKEGTDAESVMRAAIESANTAIYQMAHELPQLSSMATTIVALHVADNIATIGHVGDSRLYRVDGRGNLYRETDDHSMVGDEVRAGRMTEEQAETHPGRNIINRALGAEAIVEVDTKTIMVGAGTSFLLCSDGITRHVGDQEIKGTLAHGGDPEDICDYLKNLVFERGAEDNFTAVIVKVAGEPPPELETEEFIPEDDEPTITTPRIIRDQTSDDDEDELLELDTMRLQRPVLEDPVVEEHAPSDIADTSESFRRDVIADTSPPVTNYDSHPYSTYVDESSETVSVARKYGFAVLWLLIGSVLGAGFYYFAIAPKPVDTGGPGLSEMRAANIPLSAFEENRRNVDKNPALYITNYAATPQDCEDYYLLGRAYLLTGDFIKARIAFTEARNRLSDADPVNANILASDIAVAMAITNDTTIQTIVKKELDALHRIPANTANSNR